MIYNYFKPLFKAFLLIIFMGSQLTNAQVTYTFTTAGATGANGPTQAMVNTAYASTNLAGNVTVTGASPGIQQWVVPSSGKYKITALGAQGGGANGGLGASMEGEFTLLQNQVLLIVVGQQGITEAAQPNSVGGGGGSFVVLSPGTTTGDILVIAGGGGGSPSSAYPIRDANSTTSGNNGHVDSGVSNPDGLGGTGGSGGNKAVSGCSLDRGAGGGGFLTDGGSICQTAGRADGGKAFVNGCKGGEHNDTGAEGGFGGGGAVWSTGFRGGGGGGGYSGGGGGQINSNSPNHSGGGGGSYNTGTNQLNIAGVRSGNGQVIIERLPSAPDDAGVSALISPTSNCVGTYPVTAEISNFGVNQIANVTVNWSINGIAQAPYVHSTLLDTSGGTGPSSATINLGNITLAASTTYNIKIWTLNPNGVNDTINSNDTTLKPVTGYAYPTINLGPDVSICPEDSITFDAGTGRDSVLWSTSDETQTIRVNTPGQYFVGVFKNGCESRDTINLTHYPGAPDIDFGPDTIICSDDSLILDATQPGVTYSWQDGSMAPAFTAKNVGNYWVNIEDANGCKNGDTIKVVHYAEPTIFLTVSPGNSVCYGVPITFTALATSQGSKDYQWKVNGANSGPVTSSNTFSPSLNYGDSVMVDLVTDLCADGGTRSIPSQWINMSINPQPKFINGPDTVLENSQDVYAVSLSPGNSYSWSVVGGTISGSSTGNTVTVNWGLDNDSAKVICEETDNKNCTYPNVKNVVVASIIGINESGERISMGYPYPNPAHSSITIPLSGKGQWEVTLDLYDITGKMVKPIYNGEIRGSKQITFDVDELKDGMYFCKITTSDGHELVRKISIQR